MLNNIENDVYYTPEELGKKFKLSLSSVYKLVRSGEIPTLRLGKVYRIPSSQLNLYLQKKEKMAVGIKPVIPKTVEAFLGFLRSSPLKDRVKQVYLYGSYARGDFDEDSDVDLTVIVESLDLKARRLVSSLSERAMADHDYQDLLSVSERDLSSWERMQKENYPLVQNILREGIPLWKNP